MVALALPLAAGGATAAVPPKDYSQNGATGDYAPQKIYKDYSKNGATGDYSPPVTTTAPAVRVAAAHQSFAWGDAALGSGSTLVLVMLAGASARRIRRRRIPAPAPARPTAA
jgi:hypothetical protein